MKNRIRSFCLLLSLFVLFLSGCSAKEEIVATNQIYDIVRKEDWYYIRIKKESGYNTAKYYDFDIMSEIDPHTYFPDLQSMKQAILEGDITEEKFLYATFLRKDAAVDNYTTLIFNPYQLYQIYLPKGAVMKGEIIWYVWDYKFFYNLLDRQGSGNIRVLHEKAYFTEISRFNDKIAGIKASAREKDPTVYIVEEVEDPETGEYRIHYERTSWNGDVSANLLTKEMYKTPEKTLHIIRIYNNYSGAGNAVPTSIEVYGEENGGYFAVFLSGLKENVDAQYLSQFGITPFEGNEPPPAAIG